MAQQFHAEGLGPPRHLEPYAAQAENAKLLAPQLGSLQRLLLPFAGMQQGVGSGQLAGQRKHQPDGQLGDGDGVGAGRIHHHDAPAGRRIGVDVVDSHAGASDHPQLGSRLQQCFIHLDGGTNHERIGVRQFRGQSVLYLIVGYDLPTGLACKHSQGGGRDFLCQYDLHRSPKDLCTARA